MVRTTLALAAACSAFAGLSNAAALGSAEEYADGTVHGRIMAMKMVRSHHIPLRLAVPAWLMYLRRQG
jgi:hypothetical protein